jgi:hypothetical protein
MVSQRFTKISKISHNGYAGAISKNRNFLGWQKKHNKSENYR